MSHHLIMFKEDSKFWVDTGHADVGPFDTRKEAREHMDRIVFDREEHAKKLKEASDILEPKEVWTIYKERNLSND